MLATAAGPVLAGGLGSGCNLVSSGLDNVVAEPFETVVFQFTVQEDTPGSCSMAEGDFVLDAPDGSAILESPATWTGTVGETIDVELETTDTPGTATLTASCSLCSGSPVVFTLGTVEASGWTLTLVDPVDGAAVTGGQTVELVIEASENGGPVSSDEPVRWEFVSNTNGSSFIGAAGGAPIDRLTDADSRNRVQLQVGSPNAGVQPITIRATIGYSSPATQESLTFTLTASDVLTVDSNNPVADGQSGAEGVPVPVPYSVVVHRNGVADAAAGPIEWSVSPAGAVSFSQEETPTDSGGVATVNATFGAVVGPFTVTATHADSPDIFETFAGEVLAEDYTIALPATGNGSGQSGPPGTALPEPLVAIVFESGFAAEDVSITWSVVSGDAVLTGPNPVESDDEGLAPMTVTLGSTVGDSIIRATVTDYPSAFTDFIVTVTGGNYTIDKTDVDSGDNQTGAPGTTLQPLRVVVRDDGSELSGAQVNWSVFSGSATLSAPSSVTDATGVATIDVTLGATAGPVVITATRDDVAGISTSFNLTTVGGTPVLALDKPPTGSGDGQSATVGEPVPQPLKAVATNDGEGVGGVTVNWTVESGSASLSAPSSTTDTLGETGVTVTFGPTPGPVVIRATRADAPTATTTYNLTALPNDSVVYSLRKPSVGSGDGQDGDTGEPLAQSLVVIAENDGVAAPGVVVEWEVTGGDATLDAPTSVSNLGGRASMGLTFGDTPGTVTVTATRSDAPMATSTFVLTADVAEPDRLGLEMPADSGDGSTAAPGSTITLSARTTRNTIPASFIRVVWEVISGDGVVRPTISTSANRIATTRLTVGNAPGAIRVRAYLVDAPDVQLVYTINGADAGDLAIVSGNNQSGAPGTTLAPLVVRYSVDGTPVADAPVNWTVLDGDATLANTSTSTNSGGDASVELTLGDTPGPVRVQASAGGDSVVFDLSVGSAGPILTIVDGNGQRGASETAADEPLVVAVRTADGNAVAGQTVQWDVTGGSATLDAASTVSGSDGRSSVQLTFGSGAGTVSVLAFLPGQRAQGVTFTLTAVAATLVVHSGDGQTGAPGDTLTQDFVVQAGVPAAGKALGGVTVTWTVLDGGGSLDVASSTTDAQGFARTRLTLGPQPGTQRVRASVAGGAEALFTATAVVPAGSSIDAVSGNGQTLATQAASAPLVVVVRDDAGNPVAGATVNWSGDNASVSQASSVTGSDGRASVTARVLLPGAASVTATLDGSDESATFSLNGGLANVVGLTPPQEDLARAIDRFCPELASRSNLTPEQADLRARCLELVDNAGSAPGDTRDALEALRQDVAFGQSNAAYAAVGAQFDNLKTRIAALRSGSSGMDLGGLALASSTGVVPLSLLPADENDDGGAEVGGDFSRWGFFASGTIGRGSQDGDDATPDYDFDSNGLTAGVDYRLNDRMVIGVSAGWNRQDTDLARDGGSVETRGWSLSAYSTWYRDNAFYVDGVLTFGSNDYDLERSVRYALQAADGSTTSIDQRATASSGGDQRSFALSLGRDFQKGAWSLGPYLRGTLTQVDFDAYSERMLANLPGAGLALAVDARDLESRTAVLGGKATYTVSRDWGILMPHMQLEWEHEFQDDPDALVARFLHDPTFTAIATEGSALDTNYYNVGFGLSALFPGGKSGFLYYERLIGASGQSRDNLSLGVRIEF